MRDCTHQRLGFVGKGKKKSCNSYLEEMIGVGVLWWSGLGDTLLQLLEREGLVVGER